MESNRVGFEQPVGEQEFDFDRLGMPKVFCIGFGKTGTTSFGVAMERLGYRHCGFDSRLLEQYAVGDWKGLAETVRKYESFDDFPWPLCYRWIAEHWPDSKFVLTVRATPETWYQSLLNHAERGIGTERNRAIAYGRRSPKEGRNYHIELYKRHLAEVQSFFADQPERLLIVCWERGDGWAELQPFLGSAVPKEAFPHANRSEKWLGRNMRKVFARVLRAFQNGR